MTTTKKTAHHDAPKKHDVAEHTTEHVVQKSPYVGFWVRVAAYTIDSFVINVVTVPLWFILGMFVAMIDNKGMSFLFTMFLYGLSLAVVFVYYIVFTYKYQATLGKMAVGIKVMAQDGEKLPLGRIILRETIGKLLSALLLMIGYFMIAFTDKKQGLHDKLAQSVVIYKDPVMRARGWVVGIALGIYGFFVIISLIFFIGIMLVAGMFATSSYDKFNSEGVHPDQYYDYDYDGDVMDDADIDEYYDSIEEYTGPDVDGLPAESIDGTNEQLQESL